MLALAERWVHGWRSVEVDPLDVGPKHVFGALTAVNEDQHAGIPLAEVAGRLKLELLAAMEDHAGTLGAALFAAGGEIEAIRPKGMV